MVLPALVELEANAGRILLLDAVRAVNPRLVFSGHWHQRMSGRIPGSQTEVHVLDMDGRAGNVVVLNLAAFNAAGMSVAGRKAL